MGIKELQKEIRGLLKKKNAILLVHNYERPEIQDIADLTGDSLGLSIEASKTNAEIIVFCGVHFMAETASIVCPDKTVLLPVISAGCPMADMITAQALIKKKKELPGIPVVSYVNSPASVKAESDICCTSANAIQVIKSLVNDNTILMTPDRNLAQYTQRYTNKKIIYWEGFCPYHDALTPEQVKRVKNDYPEALFLAHPECRPEVIDLADEAKSTSGMLDYVRKSQHMEFIIGTETGIIHTLKTQNPDKEFIPADEKMICTDMKKIHLTDIVNSLLHISPVIKVAEGIRVRAIKAIERMLAVPRD
ncbi:MAG: quinolinate synthase NadA [Deltaproteobacteria bacterium]|nr:quinolinate synthase NadA [Deltaproteobacteria bacterium]MBW2105436.1 quinolinate synthase NadA [Deltaproteobacteria bacterium]MBW2332264.1 quinolinate synthase NadA [Deltaproteobacteria bacterium]OQY15806.1 MAG: quinolinate synthase [Desulfobacterium sp. 4572_20]HDH87195.1 quinolinate synthase NadA [Desulfobacteraceae bacterium]